MSLRMKKLCYITMFLIITTLIVILFIGIFTKPSITEFDGTLVELLYSHWSSV